MPIDTAYIKANSEFVTPLDFAKSVIEGKTKYSDIKWIKPIIRLHPPLKGYEGIKRAYTVGRIRLGAQVARDICKAPINLIRS